MVRQHPGPYPGIPAAPIALVEGIWKPSGLLCLFRTGLPKAEEISLCSTNFPKLRISASGGRTTQKVHQRKLLSGLKFMANRVLAAGRWA